MTTQATRVTALALAAVVAATAMVMFAGSASAFFDRVFVLMASKPR